jgi:NAD(P)-dependent dehydrogenase (short-subunit alcohol dehydrogenase family)
MEIKNKIALVTGGVVRVGYAISLELLNSNVQLYCHYNSSEEQAQQFKKQYPAIHLIKADLSIYKSAKEVVQYVIDKAGTIDILVNNAAIYLKTPFGEISEEDWERHLNINLKSGFFLAQAAGKIMQKNGRGKIVNIADTSGLSPWPSYIPYSISKSGVISMTKGLAKALAPAVQVNAVNPGPVCLPANYTAEQKQKAVERTLLKREGSAEDVAQVVRFLIEDGDYITGTAISVDGGRSLL